jgi:ElaB/YqjD/DUF883 family membrane-anchored ribosome-binding protein
MNDEYFEVIAEEEAMPEVAFLKTMRVGEKIAEAVSDIENAKAALSEVVDEGKEAARRTLKRGRRFAEDWEEEAVRGVRQYPRATVAVTFGVAMGAGLLVGWLFGRARR